MVRANRSLSGRLEDHSPALFLFAGVLLVGYAALNGLDAFADARFEQNLFQFGYVVAFLGLLGLYPRLVERRPWLARTGAGAAVLGLVAFVGFTVLDFAALAGITEGGQPPGPLIAMGVAGFFLGYLSLGAAVLRSDALSRAAGLFLLVPGGIIILMLIHIAAGLDSPKTAFVISAGQAMAHLATGATLKVETESTDQGEAESAPDATARG